MQLYITLARTPAVLRWDKNSSGTKLVLRVLYGAASALANLMSSCQNLSGLGKVTLSEPSIPRGEFHFFDLLCNEGIRTCTSQDLLKQCPSSVLSNPLLKHARRDAHTMRKYRHSCCWMCSCTHCLAEERQSWRSTHR